MGKRRDTGRKKNTENFDFLGYGVADDSTLSREKGKAKQLRNTSWWARKRSPGICHYCGKKVSPSELTMDHIIPISRGGKSEKHNLVPACKECNNKKKYLLPAEWEEHIKILQDRNKSQE